MGKSRLIPGQAPKARRLPGNKKNGGQDFGVLMRIVKPESVSAVVSASAHDLSNPDFVTDDRINDSETSDSHDQFFIHTAPFPGSRSS